MVSDKEARALNKALSMIEWQNLRVLEDFPMSAREDLTGIQERARAIGWSLNLDDPYPDQWTMEKLKTLEAKGLAVLEGDQYVITDLGRQVHVAGQ